MGNKYNPINLFLKTYIYDIWFENEELTDKEEPVDLSDMSPPEDDEWRKSIKNITSNQTINLTSSIISANKIWKQFNQIKKRNQANTISFISA